MLKQCTWHDKIQARDMWCSASEFYCVANIIMMFGDVPGCDDSSGGMARSLEFIDYLKVYNENPDAKKNEMLINNDLLGLFDSAPYAATFFAYLIDKFKATGFKIHVPIQSNSEIGFK